jgi:RHS repeat-associated protein
VTKCSSTSLSAAVNGNNQFTGNTYDAAGNLTNDGTYTYTYNAENEITTANGTTYTYDGNRKRVKKTGGTLYFRTIAGDVIAETNLSGATTNEYVVFSGRKIARRDSTGAAFYYQADQLGSIRSGIQSNGALCYDADYTPYGQEMQHTNTCVQKYKFTGYERDSETGLDYAMNRYYNPRLGRFMSPDPSGLALASFNAPQSLNQYAYVLNNPLSAVDPSGLTCVWDDGSYDSFDDPSTGSSASCGSQGGTWFEGNTDDYNSNGNSFLAQIVSVAQNMGWTDLTQSQQDSIASGLNAGLSVDKVTKALSANNDFKRSSNRGLKKYHCDLFGTCYQGPQIDRPDPAKAIKWYLCGDGVFDNVRNYTLEGLGKGAVFGGIFGSEFGPEGTVLGVVGGAVEGFFSGNAVGWLATTGCQAAGMYGPRF